MCEPIGGTHVRIRKALLSSSSSASKAFIVKIKGLIAEAYEWDEEEVSSNDNEMVEVKVLMALAKENDVVSKKVPKMVNGILPSESQRNTTDSSVTVTDSSTTDYDSADKSSICSIPLPPLKKLDDVEPISGPKTLKLILSISKVWVECLQDLTSQDHQNASFHLAFTVVISQNFSSPYTLEQNGVAERKNKTLREAARTMLSGSIFSKQYWTEAVSTECYTQNSVEDTSVHNTIPIPIPPLPVPSMVTQAPQDRWSKDKHIELVNIISNSGARMLIRAMAKELSAALAHERLFVDFISKKEPKKVSEALKHLG
nr:retrovirus-related Pol polyprotein from transposon TNT 1-94 [Tanacetum cinerariifolium]